ncbi:MAG: hypothetical protein Q7R43_05685 [Candidatus Daviesbacteria bacterium]|nr:hypothetical protein [Candidatus Daviesbacteria bacterium]
MVNYSFLRTFLIIVFFLFTLISPQIIEARITPEDIVQEKRVVYETKVKNYSAQDKQKLEKLSQDIALVNKKRTDELENIMIAQGNILDEYESRQKGPSGNLRMNKNVEAIKNARYWITYAHEAVAYQAAKIYIYNLTSEGNIKNDAVSLINQMAGELNSSRTKVINSQKTLEKTIND